MAKGKTPQGRTAHRVNVWKGRAMAAEASASHGVRRAGRITVYRTKGHAQELVHGASTRRRRRAVEQPKEEVAAVEEKQPSPETKPVAAEENKPRETKPVEPERRAPRDA